MLLNPSLPDDVFSLPAHASVNKNTGTRTLRAFDSAHNSVIFYSSIIYSIST